MLDKFQSLDFFKDNKYSSLKYFSQFKTSIYIRGIEEAIVSMAKDRKLRGPIHSYVGEEAVATGVLSNASDSDAIAVP